MNSVPMRRRTALAIGLSLIVAGLAGGQSVDGTLTGRVSDPSGALVPSVTVLVTNQFTNAQTSTVTNAEGEYRLEHLPVGAYTVTTTRAGFAAATISNVSVELNRTGTLEIRLALASATTTTVAVEAGTSLDLSTSQLQTNFDAMQLVGVPTAAFGSGPVNLSLLAAGVSSSGGLGIGIGPSVGGQRPTGNRFYVEGTDNNSYFSPSPLGYIPNEAVAEFTILQNNFGPEFGGGPGGLFNTVVKTGGNQLHGSLYEYNQNRLLMATDASAARQGLTSAPRLDNNRFGGTVGGRIIRDKLFYFGDYEYNPIGFAYLPPSVVNAPTSAGYQLLASLPGLSKTNLGVLQQYVPAAAQATSTISVGGTAVPIGPISITAPSYANQTHGVGSLDWDARASDRLRGRYMYSGYSGIDTSAGLPVFFTKQPSNANLISLSEFHTFSARAINDFRLSYSRVNSRETAGDFHYPGLDAFPFLRIEELRLQVGPSPNVPSGTLQGNLGASDMISYTVGKHALKAGYDFHDIILTTSFVSNPRGFYDYLSLNTFLQDLSPDFSGNRFQGTGANGMPGGFLQNAAYVNDDFRVLPNLTLNLGVRYEYVTVPVLSRAQQFSSIANLPGVLTFQEPKPTGNDWSPRVGFAYSPGKSGVWSIRGGVSRAFDMPYVNIAANTALEFYGSSASVNPTVPISSFLANGGIPLTSGILSSVAAARAGISAYTEDQQRPYAVSETLSIERRLGQDYVVEARYLHSRGVHLLVQEQLNRNAIVTPTQFIPTYLAMPSAAQLASLALTTGQLKSISANPLLPYGIANAITDYAPRGNSRYNGLALQLTRRYSHNLSFIAAYTYSHNMDDSTATVNTTLLTPRRPQDFNDIQAECATSMLDRRHRFTFSPVYEITAFRSRGWALRNLAGNWTASFTYTYESPAFATVASNVDSNLNTDAAGDRAIVNPAGDANTGSGVTGYNAAGVAQAANSNTIVAYVANNPNARYIVAAVGALANGGRNTFPLDPINNVDISLRKRLSITERVKLEVGGEFLNLMNHPQFTGGYVNDVGQSKNANRNFLIPNNPAFGQYQQFFPSNSRMGQVLARITF
jgi:Carboxypeptidase regulatory-like domain/TonB dependent receptor